MKIFKKSVAIVRFHMDIHYFESYAEVFPSHGTKSVWTRDEENVLTWTYMHSFVLSAEGSDHDFLQCLQQTELKCRFDDIYREVDELVGIKKELDLAMKAFLEENIWTFASHLHYQLAGDDYYEACKPNDVAGIQMAFEIPFKAKTQDQLAFEQKMKRSIPFFDRHDPPSKTHPRSLQETRTSTVILKPPPPPSILSQD